MTTTPTTLDAKQFDTLFDQIASTAERLEARPAYHVPGEAALLNAWRHGEPRPERSVRTSPWLARIAVTTATAGKVWSRIRVVDDPMTDAQRYALEAYRESQAAGERIFLAPRMAVEVDGPDFWLLDRRLAVLMHYHPDGQLDRRELVEDQEVVSECARQFDQLAARAVALNVFLAAHSA